MKIDLEKNELALIKQLVKKEYESFKEIEEEILRPEVAELALEEKYEDFLQKLLEKLK